MALIVKKGLVGWRNMPSDYVPAADEVVQTGLVDMGQPERNVWDAALQQLRPFNASEIAAKQAAADRLAADLAAQQLEIARAKQAYANLQAIVDGIDAANLVQAKTAIKQMANIMQGLIRATVGK